MATTSNPQDYSKECKECNGTGIISFTKHKRYWLIFASPPQPIYCTCWGGRIQPKEVRFYPDRIEPEVIY